MDRPTEEGAITALRQCFTNPRRVLEAPVGVTIIFQSPLRKEKLR